MLIGRKGSETEMLEIVISILYLYLYLSAYIKYVIKF